MKKIILLAAFGVAGLVNAKESKQVLKSENCKQTTVAFTRYLVTIKTICGTLHQTVFDTEFDSPDCLKDEWEMHNKNDCGRASFENPPV